MSMIKEITCTVLGGLITYIIIDKVYNRQAHSETSLRGMNNSATAWNGGVSSSSNVADLNVDGDQ